jgi:uncharacterized protein DUF6328
VVSTGVQILFGFLLTTSFSARFDALDAFRHTAFLVTMNSGAVSSTLLLARVAGHASCSCAGSSASWWPAATLALTLSSRLMLVLNMVVGRAGRWAAPPG